MSILKRAAFASAMASVLVLGVATTASADLNTSTKSGVFTVDATTVKAGSKVNLSILGLNAQGEIDTKGEQFGSTIVATVTSALGEVEAGDENNANPKTDLGKSGDKPATALFEKDVDGATTAYVKLVGGKGKVNISYPIEAGGFSDTIDITLQEFYTPTGGGTTRNVIDSAQKIITVDTADLNVALLDITEFTGGDNVDTDTADGIDGKTTAGKEGAQIKVVAYKDIAIDYAMGNTTTPIVSGLNQNEAVSGIVKVILRPKDAELVGGNVSTESITLPESNMSKGEATVYIPSGVTAAGLYYMEATLEGYDDLSSVDMYNDDTLEVNPVNQPKKVWLSSEKGTISDNNDAISGTQLTACLLDQYGNRTPANQSYTVNLKDDTEHVSNTAIDFSFSSGQVCVFDNSTILGDAKDEALKLGTASMVAYIKNQTAIAESDPVSLKIVADQLVAAAPLFTPKAPIQAGVSITQNVLGLNAFQVRKDDGDGAFSTADSFINTGGPTEMNIRHMYKGAPVFAFLGPMQLEPATNGTIGQNEDGLGARFDKSSSKSATNLDYEGEYYILADTNGDYGEVIVPAAIAGAPDIIPASPSKYKMVNAHEQEITSIKASKKANTDPINYWALFRENNLKLEDDFGNKTSPSQPLALLSSNGTVSNDSDLSANEEEGNVSTVTYDPNTFPGGEDAVKLVFKEPKLTGSDITVNVQVNQALEQIKLDVESDKIPVNGMVPVRVTSWDQFGELYAHPKGVFLEIDVPSTVAVRVYYVDGDGNETIITSNSLIPNSKMSARSVLAVYALNGTSGNFTLKVRNADNNIIAEQPFEITRKFEEFKVEPTEVTVISGQTVDVTISGGSEPYTVASTDEAIASATLDGTTITITGVSEEAANTTLTVTDANNKTVTVAVSVTAPASQEECEADGNVYIDGQCQPLPNTGGTGGEGSMVINPDGTMSSSDAQFSGGWSEDGGPYNPSLTYRGGEAIITQVLRFDSAHVGEEVEIIVVLAVQMPPSFGPIYWYWFEAGGAVLPPGPFLSLDVTKVGTFETHTVVADEPKVLGPYNLGVLQDLPVADFKFYFGYRLDSGEIIFGAEPSTIKIR
jgi:hypothetical protein